MKKIFAFLLLVTVLSFTAHTAAANHIPEFAQKAGWVKSKNSIWIGQYNVKYKIDKKGKVSVCRDGKTWKPAKDGIWLDHLGKWMKIEGKMVKWSNDEGKTWSETPGWKWMGGDGRWYKLDKQMALWVS